MNQNSNNTIKLVSTLFILLFIVTSIVSYFYLLNQDISKHSNVFIFLGVITVIEIVISISLIRYTQKKYKEDLLGFCPSEIRMLYSEYKSLISQLNEAVISVNKDYTISTINEPFKKMFHLSDSDKGRNVYEVFPHINFRDIILTEKTTQNKLVDIFDEKILLSTFPLYLEGEVIGATAIIRSRLEVDMLLDQISGYRKISKALREQKHEFQNKLHVIMGLIQMKDYETVTSYIMQNIYTTNLTSDYYSSRLKDDKVSALFVGKEIQSKEYETTIKLTSDSNLSSHHEPISSDDLVIVLGNLIDNSLEAFKSNNIDNRKITVKIHETDDQILMGVSDNAGGIDPTVRNRMFKRGVSTKKGDSRGTGLSLVNEIVSMYNGTKQVQSSKHNTYIEIILKKVRQ